MGRIVDMLGIGHLLGRRPERCRAARNSGLRSGRALLASPRLILADEPLASLDEARKAEILPYFERLRDEVSVPVLYVSHSAAEVARLATTVIALQDGRVVRQGPAVEVLGDPTVTPLGARGAGAVLEAAVVTHHADGLSEIDAGGVRPVPAEGSRIRRAAGSGSGSRRMKCCCPARNRRAVGAEHPARHGRVGPGGERGREPSCRFARRPARSSPARPPFDRGAGAGGGRALPRRHQDRRHRTGKK